MRAKAVLYQENNLFTKRPSKICNPLLTSFEQVLWTVVEVSPLFANSTPLKDPPHCQPTRGSVYELDRQMKCHRTGSVTELDETK